MLMARYRLGLVAEGRVESNSTVWQCAKLSALPLHNWATPLLGLLPLTTSLNFLACSKAPLWYLRQGVAYTASIITGATRSASDNPCSAPHLVSLALSMLNYVVIWGDPTPMPALCVAAKGAAHPFTYGCMLALRMLAHFASAVIYAGILIYLKQAENTGMEELNSQQRKIHRNATITLGCVTLNSFFLLLIPDLLLFFNPKNISKDYSTLLYSMTLSKTTINFFIYMWRYKELRDMVVTTTCRRVPRLRQYFPDGFTKTSVAPTGYNSSGTKPERRRTFLDDARRTTTVLAVAKSEISSTKSATEEEFKRSANEDKEERRKEEDSSLQSANMTRIIEIRKYPLETARSEILLDVSRFWYNI